MDLIKKEEPLEGFKGRKVEPRETVLDEDTEDFPDTKAVFEMRCDTFNDMFQDNSEKSGKNSEGLYSESDRSWRFIPGSLDRW